MSKIINVWINGISGRTGQCLETLIHEDKTYKLLGGSSKETFLEESKKLKDADLVIDFSTEAGNASLIHLLKEEPFLQKKSFLICTTGLKQETLSFWKDLPSKEKEAKVLVAPNTSLGILFTREASLAIAQRAHAEGFDLVLEETHHRYKKDAPSGTALFLAESLGTATDLRVVTDCDHKKNQPQETIHVHASRGGGVFGEHTIRFISDNEEISITHRAFSRDLFAKGALFLGKWLHAQKGGFYSPENVSS